MIAGLYWTAWLLLVLAVVPGLALALLFLRAHRGDPRPAADPATGDGP